MNNNFTIIHNLLDRQNKDRLFIYPSYDFMSVTKCVTALANGTGGDIIIGVDESDKIIGVESAELILSEILSKVRSAIAPTVALFAEIFEKDYKNVILVSVWEGAKKPYLTYGTIYVVKGSDITVANASSVNALIGQRIDSENNWERDIVVGSSLEDLDNHQVLNLMKKLNTEIKNPNDFLQQQGLIRGGSVTNAGMVLFGINPDKFIPQVRVRLSVFTSTSDLATTEVFSGNMFRMVNEITARLDTIYGHRILIDGLYRREDKAYPVVAFREAILNALIHRKISSPECYVTISVYPTHTDVMNFGELMQGVTVNSLKKEHISVLRNPDIAYYAYLDGLVELAGSGTLRMIEDCAEHAFPSPKWTATSNSVKVSFVGVRSKMEKTITIDEGSVISTNKMSAEKNAQIKKVIDIMKKNGGKAKTAEILTVIDKSVPTVKRLIQLMVSLGIIIYIGSKRDGYYHLAGE